MTILIGRILGIRRTNANLFDWRHAMRRVRATTLLALGAALPVLAQESQEPAEILIRNGVIVTESGRLRADLRIRSGEIAEIGRNLRPARGARTFDATGKLVLPGGIDTHVHLTPVRTPNTRPGTDDFESASRAALAGGITTIGAFIGQNPEVPAARPSPRPPTAASRTTIADAILHFTIGDPAKLSPADLTMLRERGVTPKIFMRGMAFEQHLSDNLKLIEAGRQSGTAHTAPRGGRGDPRGRDGPAGRGGPYRTGGPELRGLTPGGSRGGGHAARGRLRRVHGRSDLPGACVVGARDARGRGRTRARASPCSRRCASSTCT
jgi:hypothetical protein